MAEAEYRGLRMLLRVLAALLAVGSMFMIFSSKELLTRMFLMPQVADVSTLLLFVVKELGGIMLMLGTLMSLAARDPVRNVAIIDAFILGFCVLAVTPLVARAMLPIREIYPDLLVWGRSVVRLAIAGVLYWLRPRGAYVRGA